MLIDSCRDVVLEGVGDYQVLSANFLPPVAGTDQTASLLITGSTSDVVLQNCKVGAGAGT